MKIFLFILYSVIAINAMAQENPHGDAFDLSCGTCHSSDNWHNIARNTFDHDQTAFALKGAHKNIKCMGCHSNLQFREARSDCFECHTDIHKNELGNNCSECHNENGWDDHSGFVQFHNQTDFPLTGVHAVVDCESCHLKEQQRQYANTAVECSACHLDVFMTTLNPDHQKAGFDDNCERCHMTTSSGWKKSIFDHTNNFPLKGGHAGVACEECHGADYSIKKVICVDCHQGEYDATVNPDHRAFLFSSDCEECHTGISWEKTIFSHLAVSGFALEESHKMINCVACHQNNQLTGLSHECAGCHLQEYNTTTDPNHIAALFPTTCEDCHSAKNWASVKWDHDADYFPIYSGNHRGEWNACSDCHVYPGNYVQFECINCHAHRQSKMDDEHSGRRNYVYESQACYNCHPRGKE